MTNTLPNGWEMAKLEDIVDILDNKRVPINSKERETRQGPIPYYGATGQVGWIDDFLFDEELVLLGEDGAPFFDSAKQKAYVIRGKSWVNNHAHVLRAKNGIPNAYIKYYLDIVDYHGFVTGTTRHKLNQTAMRQIPIPVAPPGQQKRIVAEIEKQFSRLDEAVANLKRVKANLKRYKAAVLKAAVEGRLVETEAELARREGRSFETGEQLLQCILETRRSQWKGKGKYKEPAAPAITDLPELPEGWVWVVSDVVFDFVTSGSRGWAKYYSDTGAIFIRIGNLDHGTIDLDLSEVQHVNAPSNPEAERSRVSPGDLLISITAELGMVAVALAKLGQAYINQHVAIARSTGWVDSNYIGWYFACEHAGKKQLELLRRGATKAGLGLDDIRSVYIALPPREEQHRIVTEVDRRLSLVREVEAHVEANLKRAARMRQTILANAYSGKLIRDKTMASAQQVILESVSGKLGRYSNGLY